MTKFAESFEIGGRSVGGDAPCLIIAEAGVAHFGDMELAGQLVDLAADAGADIFKTQFFDVAALIAKRALDWRERLRPRNLTFTEARALKDMCDRRGLLFMSTAHDDTRVKWLRDLDVAGVKVGSGECNNPAFLTRLAQIGRPMIVSTGMYTEDDVREALSACAAGECREVALLHCVTSYPAPAEEVNLSAMNALAAMFDGPVGYSDHTDSELAVLSAVARGAKVIEKHITILRDVPNAQDWKVSSGPEDFPGLVKRIRTVEQLVGHGRKEPAPCELPGMKWAKKSLVAARDLPAGHVLTKGDLLAKRPGDGTLANRIDELTGRRLLQPVGIDEPVRLDDVE